MNLSDIGAVCAICIPLIAGGGKAGHYWANQEFVSNDDLLEYELRGLKRDARRMQREIDEGGGDPDAYFHLQEDIEELEELLEKSNG